MKYQPSRLPIDKSLTSGREFFEHMNSRRSVRLFSSDPVPQELIEIAVRTANTAPSGANQQPWFFAATSDPVVKHRIREAAEIEERENYEGGRMPPSWRKAIWFNSIGEHYFLHRSLRFNRITNLQIYSVAKIVSISEILVQGLTIAKRKIGFPSCDEGGIKPI